MQQLFNFCRAQKVSTNIVWVLAFSLCACGAPINVKPLAIEDIQLLTPANQADEKYLIVPDDVLQIRYVFHPEMNQETVVQPDGKITAALVGPVSVIGLTTKQVEELLKQKTSDALRNPEVVVNIVKFAERTVYVGGEVAKPGMVRYRRGLTPLQAVIASGGFLESARPDSVILIRNGNSNGEFISRKLNLAQSVSDPVQEPVFTAPYDIIYVPRSSIAEANLWVKQHITDLFPFLRGSAAVTYRPQ